MTWIIFIISAQAENGRGPFDLLEAESELVSGFHIEYSGMKFGMFYVAEFLHAFTMGVLFAIFFLGGWRIPFVSAEAMADTDGIWGFIVSLIGFGFLLLKSMLAYFVLIWIRMTLPRLRIDQLLDFNWKFMVPLSLVNLLVVAFVWKVVPDTDSINSAGDAFVPMLALLIANVVMIAVVLTVLRDRARRERAHIEGRIEADTVVDTAPAGAGD
jgi:NADH-quinone oxidoreductase subunit H